MAIYDDANYKVTLSADELNNYTFENLASYISTLGLNNNAVVGTFNYSTYSSNIIYLNQTVYSLSMRYQSGPSALVSITFNRSSVTFNPTANYIFKNFINDSFDSDLVLVFNSAYYEGFKAAIKADTIKFPDLVPTTNSETPEVLVKRGENGELSPNPAGFGFTQQVVINELPDESLAKPNTLYLVCVYNDNILIGYRPYKWTPTEGFVRVFNTNTPNLKAEDGGQETPVNIVTEPQERPEAVFSGKVVFNKAPTIEGKPLDKWVDTHGGVTEQEAEALIRNAIQADKDIISQIKVEYNEEDNETTFTFPSYVYPILYYNDEIGSSMYFDYATGRVRDFYNNVLGEITIADNEIYIIVTGEGPSTIEQDYLLFLGVTKSLINLASLNWLTILNPSGGTKLYKHEVSIDYGTESQILITLISNDKTTIQMNREYIFQNSIILSAQDPNGNPDLITIQTGYLSITNVFSIMGIKNDTVGLSVFHINNESVSLIEDTVTEL